MAETKISRHDQLITFTLALVGARAKQRAAAASLVKMTSLEKYELAKAGVSKNALEAIKEKAKLDYDTLARGLGTARATLINVKGKAKFNPQLSEKIVGLADIYAYGYEVFEDDIRFNEWMFRPNKALGGVMPFDVVSNQFGREEVKNLIGRIEHGVYS